MWWVDSLSTLCSLSLAVLCAEASSFHELNLFKFNPICQLLGLFPVLLKPFSILKYFTHFTQNSQSYISHPLWIHFCAGWDWWPVSPFLAPGAKEAVFSPVFALTLPKTSVGIYNHMGSVLSPPWGPRICAGFCAGIGLFVTMAQWYNLRSGTVVPPALVSAKDCFAYEF